MTVIASSVLVFAKITQHQGFEFLPGVPLGFEDEDCGPFFTTLGWAEESSDDPVRIYSREEVDVDPLTLSSRTGQWVLPERAEAELERRRLLKEAGTPVPEPDITLRPKKTEEN